MYCSYFRLNAKSPVFEGDSDYVHIMIVYLKTFLLHYGDVKLEKEESTRVLEDSTSKADAELQKK